MNIGARMLSEFDNEMKVTRTLLSVIPENKPSWKPHPKSMSLADLVTHIATIPQWGTVTLKEASFDVSPVGGKEWRPPAFTSTADLLALFDANVRELRQALESISDEAMRTEWSLLKAGTKIFSMPRIAVMRGMIMNHLIHHRGQLSVYLRLNDVPLPSIYGPTADTPA